MVCGYIARGEICSYKTPGTINKQSYVQGIKKNLIPFIYELRVNIHQEFLFKDKASPKYMTG